MCKGLSKISWRPKNTLMDIIRIHNNISFPVDTLKRYTRILRRIWHDWVTLTFSDSLNNSNYLHNIIKWPKRFKGKIEKIKMFTTSKGCESGQSR